MAFKRILICGGRDFSDWEMFLDAMKAIAENYLEKTFIAGSVPYDAVIITGDATGADSFAAAWAQSANLCLKVYKAEWNKYGKRAGYLRNKRMLDEGYPDLVVAFPGGKGTQMMTGLAVNAGIITLQVSKVNEETVINEANPKPIELTTSKYKQIFLDRVQKLGILTTGQRAGIYRDLIIEEQEWLKNMDKDYNEIMEAAEAMEKIDGNDSNKSS